MYNLGMEKFEYDVDFGAIMDFVEDHFMLVIKDEEWSDEELKLLNQPLDLHYCYTQDIAIFVLEGGDIDSSDFYFNVQDCDWKQACLQAELYDVEIVLVDKKNNVCWRKQKTLTKEQSQAIQTTLQKQADVAFMPDEYDINVGGIQSAYEPYELNKFAVVSIKY